MVKKFFVIILKYSTVYTHKQTQIIAKFKIGNLIQYISEMVLEWNKNGTVSDMNKNWIRKLDGQKACRLIV